MGIFRQLSIRQKLLSSMTACLLLFLAISTTLGLFLTASANRERALGLELPAVVGEIRNDVLRRIGEPLATSRALAGNTFLLDWEAAGLPDAGTESWQKYAAALKSQAKAATVFWVSASTGKYFTESGLNRTLSKDKPEDQWFYGFMSQSAPYTLDIDKDPGKPDYMLFINVRFDAGGKGGVAGLGLSVTSMAEAVRNYKVGRSGSVWLVRSNGTIVVHRDPALVDGKHLLKDLPGFNAELSQKLLSGQGFTSAGYDSPLGRQMLAASPISDLGLYVVVEVPEEEVLGEGRRTAWVSALAAALVGGALALMVVFWVSHAIAAPVARAAQMLGDIADGDGDLSRRMPVETGDEIGALAQAFNRFVGSLGKMVGEIRLASDSISVASQEVAVGNQDLSQRTEQTASALQQTASALSALTANVQNNTEATHSAGALARTAREVAERGGVAVNQVVQTMSSINGSSNKIAEIIGVIDGIAFQTNILALNAAVEAARAGEQGRGFAVVAAEVRALAQRSSQAAKEIRQLITASVEQVESGSDQVERAGSTMTELISSVARVTEIISEISLASAEQGRSILDINDSIAGLDLSTQQNAALVEQSAAAAASLKEQAQRLLSEVGAFKLGQQDASGTVAISQRAVLRVGSNRSA
jgi:methyl-accepting chemotaxis protein